MPWNRWCMLSDMVSAHGLFSIEKLKKWYKCPCRRQSDSLPMPAWLYLFQAWWKSTKHCYRRTLWENIIHWRRKQGYDLPLLCLDSVTVSGWTKSTTVQWPQGQQQTLIQRAIEVKRNLFVWYKRSIMPQTRLQSEMPSRIGCKWTVPQTHKSLWVPVFGHVLRCQ